MIVYQSTKHGFSQDILTNNIENIILDMFEKKLGKRTTLQEVRSWKNSMMYMETVLQDNDIPEDCGVMIEYQIPQTSKRVDFILTGQNANRVDHAIIIELKQWEKVELSEKRDLVKTFINGGIRETPHPSYQAWSYASLLNNLNEAVYNSDMQLKPCAYLHNYISNDGGAIKNNLYNEYVCKAPVFLKEDALKLREFIKGFIRYGDKGKVMFEIESGRIKPSKNLSESLLKMLKGNQEFIMVDDQKVIFENARYFIDKASEDNKIVYIVEGGPGTGKSVVAINLLAETVGQGLLAQYVSKNAAPRAVYESMLTGSYTHTEISNFFSGSGAFTECPSNSFDVLITDEAHRLNEKSGLYRNKGENQVKEIINAAKCSVFFIDENQKVTFSDIGEKDVIKYWAKENKAIVYEDILSSQFRCNGSDGYIAWLDNVLQIKETANENFADLNFDFKIVDSPSELKDIIFEKNKINNKARIVAGYCWDWVSRHDSSKYDIVFPKYNFEMKWNLSQDANLWIIAKESVNQVGCIHTCQGLEVDYVGVIVGDDLIVRNGKVLVNPQARARSDASLRGYQTLLRTQGEEAKEKVRALIKNTYRTLMTRGMKGCYVYFTDRETGDYFKTKIKATNNK